jgi:hypothetical protein
VFTDRDFRTTPAVVTFVLFADTFEEMELITTRHVYLAHAAELTFMVMTDFLPTRLVVNFAAFFADTLNLAGATEEPNLRTPEVPTASAKVISGIVMSQPSVP